MSVAIRTITRLQDADDAPTLGAGQNGYALTWDNATSAFVATALVSDHGALGGLADDDHTQYLLATGERTGASAQAQAFTVGISLPATTTSTTGVIFKGSNPLIHNFQHPTGGGAVPVGQNIFIGVDAGNFTTGSTATSTSHSSFNTAVGNQALAVITTGANNVAVGYQAMQANLTGNSNFGVGYQALLSNTTGSNNTTIGYQVLRSNTTGSNNTAVGWRAGRYHADGSTPLTDSENSIYIGYNVRAKDNSDSNSIVIGYAAIGLGANTTVVGNTSTTAATIYGAGAFPLLSAVTNAVSNVLTLTHDTSGTAAAGFGAAVAFNLQSSTTAAQSAAAIKALWYEATHASRKADLVLTAYDTAEREGLRIRGAGSAAAIGFLGATPAARQAHVADASTTHAITDPGDSPADADALRDDLVTNVIPSIETALNNLGTKINSLLTMAETFGFHATS